jgi:hypothetical protein
MTFTKGIKKLYIILKSNVHIIEFTKRKKIIAFLRVKTWGNNMAKPQKIFTVNDVFRSTDLVTINVEIPEELYSLTQKDVINNVQDGTTSLTIEQYAGVLMQIGYNWGLYKGLKKYFTGD